MGASRKVNVTKDYRLFTRSSENRNLCPKKHKKLEQSMKQYGFLPCFPIVVFRGANGKLIVKDGQHRLAIAETLGLPVHWIEETIDFDIATINCTSRVWVLRDYAEKYSANGKAAYVEGLEFADANHLPIGTAFALLGGTTSFGNVQTAFIDGTFKIKDRSWAESVAYVYTSLIELAPEIRNARFIEACMAACRVAEFDAARVIHNAKRCREKLVAYSTRDAYLEMLEEIYNFGRAKLLGLKAAATMAMRDRNAVVTKKRKQMAVA